ncbi:MAG: phosphate ABC transporter permease subunit PstC [Desulfurococcales archaeon]|nr:phosphate ABC transporter permease subunit PstC [Desulfurococcales archaeon]
MRFGKPVGKSDKLFYLSLMPFAALILATFTLIFIALVKESIPIFLKEGPRFILSATWAPSERSPSEEFYGVLAPIIGTLITSGVAIVIALPVALALTVFLEEFIPPNIKGVLSGLVDVMAGLPTVLYGLWGAYVLAPFLKTYVLATLHKGLSWLPLFSCTPATPYTLLTAGVLLSIMVTPFLTSLTREAYELVPYTYREAALSLGLTRSEYITLLLSLIRPAVTAASLLSLGRAVGETIAVSMTVGNSFALTTCLLSPGYTVSSLIANQFSNAGFYRYMTSALYGAGLALLLTGLGLNLVGLKIMSEWRSGLHG